MYVASKNNFFGATAKRKEIEIETETNAKIKNQNYNVCWSSATWMESEFASLQRVRV